MSAAAQGRPKVRLGIDVFSIRSQNWTPFEYIDYCRRHNADVCFFSELRFLGGLEPAHLKRIRDHAAKAGVSLELGMTSICPTSAMFKPELGKADEQILRSVEAAQLLGVKFIRCFLGRGEDRKQGGGIERHIENTVSVLRGVRTRVMDAGLRLAVENHAGDMQARELKSLIEAAGPEFVGCTLDSGNATWTLEDPHVTLETLAPYAVASGVRDSLVWRTPEGIAVRWVRMGAGNVDMEGWVRKFARLCPHVTLALEIISLPTPRIYKVGDPEFWKGYEGVRAHEFVRFLKLAEAGKESIAAPPPKERALEAEREELEASLRWTREVLEKL
jgi:sugar phosphate isomerase/epimerase